MSAKVFQSIFLNTVFLQLGAISKNILFQATKYHYQWRTSFIKAILGLFPVFLFCLECLCPQKHLDQKSLRNIKNHKKKTMVESHVLDRVTGFRVTIFTKINLNWMQYWVTSVLQYCWNFSKQPEIFRILLWFFTHFLISQQKYFHGKNFRQTFLYHLEQLWELWRASNGNSGILTIHEPI